VVRNIPTCKNSAQIIFVPKISDKKIILYQGALNMGRGIEYVVEAMSFIEDAVFVIIGTGTIDADLKQRVSELALNEKVMFLGRIPSEQLSAYTRQASVGVSVEQNIGLNYYFALPNKLFDYIHAEIPVLVSDLPEMRRIVETHKIGEITNDFSPENLAIMLKAMLSDDYKKTLINNILQAKKQLCWESESQVLKRIFYQIK
jgi:glycosyltransferase involved in cell wall biosynthesis